MRDGKYPEMPFNQQLSFPCDLTLRSLPEGLRIFRSPAEEIESLYKRKHSWKNRIIKPNENILKNIAGELFDIHLQIELAGAREFGITCNGEAVSYSVRKGTLTCLGREARVDAAHGQISLRILVDRTSLEVFANDGKVSMSSCFLPRPERAGLEIFADGGSSKIVSMTVHELKSMWQGAASGVVRRAGRPPSQTARTTNAVMLSRPFLASDSSTSQCATLPPARVDSGERRNSPRSLSYSLSTKPSVQSRNTSPVP